MIEEPSGKEERQGKMEGEEVAVIVPVFNRGDIVESCLDSIKHQSYRPIHLIIVDNNSTDSTPDVLRSWKERNEEEGFRITLDNEPKPGATSARNRGLLHADSRRVMFFDSDDEMYSPLIATAMGECENHPEAALVCWQHVRVNLDGSRRESRFSSSRIFEYHLIHGMLSTHAYIVDRELFLRAGAWKEDIPVWNDLEAGTRLLLQVEKEKLPIRTLPVVLYKVIAREQSITGTSFGSRAGVWEKVLDEIERDIVVSNYPGKDRLLRILDYRRVILAAHYKKEGYRDKAISLLESTLSTSRLNRLQKQLLRASYHYTSRGFRGAWLLIGWMI